MNTENLQTAKIQFAEWLADDPFVDGVNADEQTLQHHIAGDKPIRFDWQNRWLKGEEYAHIIKYMDAYC